MRGLFVVTRRLGHGLTLAQPYARTLEVLLDQIRLIIEPDGRTIRSSDGKIELDISTLIDCLIHYVVFWIRKSDLQPSDNIYLASLALLVEYEDELDEYADRYADDEDAFRFAIDGEYDVGDLLTVDRSSVTLCTCGLSHDVQG